MRVYETVTEALQDLKRRGYTLDFTLKAGQVECPQIRESLKPDEFEIREMHRFRGPSDPGDNAVLYAIRSRKTPDHRGTLINAYGMYADALSKKMADKLNFRDRP